MKQTRRPRRRGTTLALSLTLALCLVALPTAALAQTPGYDPAQFFETVEVNVVNVEVYVTDDRGHPIVGLGPEDFQIFEDGEPVRITNFYSVHAGVGEDSFAAQIAGEIPPAEVTVLPKEQRLNLLIFVDNANIMASHRAKILREVAEFVRTNIRPEDQVMVASWDGHVRVVQELTGNPQAIDDALFSMTQKQAGGSYRELDRRILMQDLETASLDDQMLSEARDVYNGIKQYAERERDRVKRAVEGLKRFVSTTAGMPGRKAVLYVSGGLNMRPGEALHYAWENKFGNLMRQIGVQSMALEAAEMDTSPLFHDLIDHANANQVTFYSIGADEGGGSYPVSAAEPAIVDMAALSTPGGGRTWTTETHTLQNVNRMTSMSYMSAATGGQSLLNASNYEGFFKKLRQDFDTYYSIGYEPLNLGDGKTHKIEVEVRGKGFKVRHRERYRAKTRAEQMSDRTLAALLREQQDNPLQVAVDFGEASPAEKRGQSLVPVMVRVPMEKLVLVPQGDVHVGRITIYVCVRDDEGRTSSVQTFPVPIRVPNEQLMTVLGQNAGYRLTLLMRSDQHSVAVGVQDDLGTADSAVRVEYSPATSES